MSVPTGLTHVPWESCAVEPVHDAELESYARRKQGICLPAIPYFAPVPWLARAVIDLRPEYGLLLQVEQQLVELVTLIVSQENSCRYCYAGVRALLWAQGVSKEHLERIEQQLSRANLPAKTVAAIAFGRSQSRSGPAAVRVACDALRTEGFDEGEIKEIAYVVAETDFSNRAHTFLAIPARFLEEMPNRWYQRLSRPLVRRVLLGRQYRGRATPLDGVPSYPYAGIVEAYAGSPIAQALRHTLDQMWASPHLTQRCKLLMLAVIAHGLESEVCAIELDHALEREGLDRIVLIEVLAHLDSAELDDCERLLVSFARETIWYEPAAVQRSARALRRTLSGPQLVEAVGVAALANGLCRLATIVMSKP
jgi:AhpD family alkylhydroperoxidase